MVKSADELRQIAKAQKEAADAVTKQQKYAKASAQQEKISGYYTEMIKIIENLSPKDIIYGFVTVYKIEGEYTREGSLNKAEHYSGPYYAGLEEAWQKLRATLEPQGYHLVRLANTYSTGGYDTPYGMTTEFIVEWDAPWILNRTPVM
jgi:hypothetical protein